MPREKGKPVMISLQSVIKIIMGVFFISGFLWGIVAYGIHNHDASAASHPDIRRIVRSNTVMVSEVRDSMIVQTRILRRLEDVINGN